MPGDIYSKLRNSMDPQKIGFPALRAASHPSIVKRPGLIGMIDVCKGKEILATSLGVSTSSIAGRFLSPGSP